MHLSDSNTVQQKHRDHPDDLIEHGPKRRQFQRKVKQYRTEHQNGTDNSVMSFNTVLNRSAPEMRSHREMVRNRFFALDLETMPVLILSSFSLFCGSSL